VGDRFDLLGGPARLAHRTHTGLVLCDGADDVYRVAVPPDEGLRVVLRHAVGDLVLALTLPGQAFAVLARSDGPYGAEVAGLDPAPVERHVDVVVGGHPGTTVPYSLSVERLPAEGCVADALEGPFGNDDAEHAADAGTGEHRVRICPADEDWLAVAVPAGSRVRASAVPDGPLDDLDLALVGADGALLATGQAVGAALVAAVDVPTPGSHYVRIRGRDQATRVVAVVAIAVLPAATAETLACAHPSPIDEGGAPAEPVPEVMVDRFAVSCGLAGGGDLLGRLVLDAPAVVSVRSDGAAALAVRAACDDPDSEVVCVFGEAPSLDRLALAAGDWFIVAKGSGDSVPSVTAVVSEPCGAGLDCPGGEVCDGGLCRAACLDDGGCPGRQTCIPATGHCSEPVACEGDEDCLGLRSCRWDGACFLPDCGEHSDCDAAACVDRTCVDAAPAECGGDADCPDPLECAPDGACVQVEPCVADADCPGGAPACDLSSGVCVGCLSRDGCHPAEYCDGLRCRFVGWCDGDDECPGERTCVAEACAPPDGCEGDRFDGGGGLAELRLRAYGGLVLCDGTEDTYRVRVGEDEGLRAVLRHDPAEGDLGLDLLADWPPYDVLAGRDGLDGVEVAGADPSPESRSVLVVVKGQPGYTVPYSLSLERRPAGWCAPDAFEGLLGNDEPARASRAGLGLHRHVVCPGESDWFFLPAPAGAVLRVASTSLDPDRAVQVGLYDPDGALVADGLPDDVGVVAEAVASRPGPYTVEVRAQEQAVRVPAELNVEAISADGAEGLACAHALVAVPGVPLALPVTLSVPRFPVSCGLGQGADHVVRFELDAPALVTVEAQGAEAVAVRARCDELASEVACDLAAAPAIRDEPLDAGTWFVVVQTFGAPRVRLLVTVQ